MYSLILWRNKKTSVVLSNSVIRRKGIVRAPWQGSNEMLGALRVVAADDNQCFLESLTLDEYGVLHFPPLQVPQIWARFDTHPESSSCTSISSSKSQKYPNENRGNGSEEVPSDCPVPSPSPSSPPPCCSSQSTSQPRERSSATECQKEVHSSMPLHDVVSESRTPSRKSSQLPPPACSHKNPSPSLSTESHSPVPSPQNSTFQSPILPVTHSCSRSPQSSSTSPPQRPQSQKRPSSRADHQPSRSSPSQHHTLLPCSSSAPVYITSHLHSISHHEQSTLQIPASHARLAIPRSPLRHSDQHVVELIRDSGVFIERESLKIILRNVVFDCGRQPDPRELARKLMKNIVGVHRRIQMSPTGDSKRDLEPIPKKPYNAIFDYVNALLPENALTLGTYRTVIGKICTALRSSQ